jgi:hypothetical protein
MSTQKLTQQIPQTQDTELSSPSTMAELDEEIIQNVMEMFEREALEEQLIAKTREEYENELKALYTEQTEQFILESMLETLPEILEPTPHEQQEIYEESSVPSQEMETLKTQQQITPQQLELHVTQRNILIERQKQIRQIEQIPIPQASINITDQTVLATLDKILFMQHPIETMQIARQLIQMCEAKTTKITRIQGYEALQKAMLQYYIPAFMEFPNTMNMYGIRLSALTHILLQGKSLTYYMMGSVSAQEMKQKATLQTCETQRLETKTISTGKQAIEEAPTKFREGETDNYTGNEKVGIPKDLMGKDLLWLALRYAFAMPYWLRRFIAMHFGMPMEHKYADYFGIGVIPTRRSLYRFNREKFPEEVKYLNYSADEYIMKMIRKYNARYGSRRPYSKRYTSRSSRKRGAIFPPYYPMW